MLEVLFKEALWENPLGVWVWSLALLAVYLPCSLYLNGTVYLDMVSNKKRYLGRCGRLASGPGFATMGEAIALPSLEYISGVSFSWKRTLLLVSFILLNLPLSALDFFSLDYSSAVGFSLASLFYLNSFTIVYALVWSAGKFLYLRCSDYLATNRVGSAALRAFFRSDSRYRFYLDEVADVAVKYILADESYYGSGVGYLGDEAVYTLVGPLKVNFVLSVHSDQIDCYYLV